MRQFNSNTNDNNNPPLIKESPIVQGLLNPSITPEQQSNIVAITRKLIGLGIEAQFTSLEKGPVVTAYMFRLGDSVPISKVLKKAEDFALSMGVDKVIVQRIEDKIAIFVPNKDRVVVDYKDILHWYMTDETVNNQQLPIALGVDFHGKKSSLDLADMPHCLITGSTGSGKSVFEASVISNFVYRFDSSQLHMYLVDTKKVDLPLFANLPHIQTVADTLDDFHNMMYVIMAETRRRLGVLQNSSCRKIQDYHKMNGGIESMPYIVLMIDEFGDLGDQDRDERKADKEKWEGTPTVKQWLKSITQIARAAGVHVIACTQRASVKVIDGDTKTNLPCRITLRLSSRVDSQVILGTGGAENLLGKGDMLVQSTESDTIKRYHGPFVSMDDIQNLVANYAEIRRAFR